MFFIRSCYLFFIGIWNCYAFSQKLGSHISIIVFDQLKECSFHKNSISTMRKCPFVSTAVLSLNTSKSLVASTSIILLKPSFSVWAPINSIWMFWARTGSNGMWCSLSFGSYFLYTLLCRRLKYELDSFWNANRSILLHIHWPATVLKGCRLWKPYCFCRRFSIRLIRCHHHFWKYLHYSMVNWHLQSKQDFFLWYKTVF